MGIIKSLLLFFALAALGSAADYVRTADGVLLPDPAITPGVIRTSDARQICAPNFRTGPYRKTTVATKKAVCRAYGVKDCPHEGAYEIDHVIPLEIGGADDIRNLWPQPAKPEPGFHQKDALEDRLRAEVCAGRVSLSTAQHELQTNWYASWKKRLP